MGQIDEMEAKLDWCVAALKHLLMGEAGVQPEEWELEAELAEYEDPEDMSQFEHVAVRRPPKVQEPPPCPHQHQVLVDGVVRCARCSQPLNTSGLIRNQVSPSGQVMHDPNPPQWARERSRGASSKNPGTPLVPHSVG